MVTHLTLICFLQKRDVVEGSAGNRFMVKETQNGHVEIVV